MIYPEDYESDAISSSEAAELPLYRDWAYDFDADCLALRGGRNYIIEGAEALKVWIYKALKTTKGRYAAYGAEYGQEFCELIGCTDSELIEMELERMISEALEASEYITGVSDFGFERSGSTMSVSFVASTVYGDTAETIDVEVFEWV